MFTFTVTRNAGDDINVPITVAFDVGGTASYPSDYTVTGATSFSATTGSILIPAGQSSESFTVTPVPDLVVEANETIVLTPQAQSGVFVVGAGSAWTVTITNDDAGASDPLFANVVFLMLPIGADNSATFSDSSSYARTITAVGDTKIVSNKAVFDGAGDRLTIPASPNFAMGSGNFCFETEIETTQTTSFASFMARGSSGFGSGSWAILISPAGTLDVYWRDFSPSTSLFASTTAINDGILRHVAWDRSGSTHRLFVAGVLEATVTSSLAMTDSGGALVIGDDLNFGGRNYNGKNKAIRLTSASRYTSNFTPPAFYPTN